jgi:hypothetical protein
MRVRRCLKRASSVSQRARTALHRLSRLHPEAVCVWRVATFGMRADRSQPGYHRAATDLRTFFRSCVINRCVRCSRGRQTGHSYVVYLTLVPGSWRGDLTSIGVALIYTSAVSDQRMCRQSQHLNDPIAHPILMPIGCAPFHGLIAQAGARCSVLENAAMVSGSRARPHVRAAEYSGLRRSSAARPLRVARRRIIRGTEPRNESGWIAVGMICQRMGSG